jgi:branched-chain amino acid transport system substrate-binding protein
LVPGIYTKLLDVDKVDLVVSAYGTNVAAPALPVIIQHNKTFMGLFAMDGGAGSAGRDLRGLFRDRQGQ